MVSFMTGHLGCHIPSPAILEKIGTRFRRAVRTFAEANQVPLVKFAKGDRKIDVMRRYLDAQAKIGESAVVAIGFAQEFQNVFAANQRQGSNGIPWFTFTKADRRVTCFYFYLWDENFGRSLIGATWSGSAVPATRPILVPATIRPYSPTISYPSSTFITNSLQPLAM